MSKFALFKYSTINLGDEIQSIAAAQYLPKIDRLINRDMLSLVTSKEKLNLIANGWFMHNMGVSLEVHLKTLKKSATSKPAKQLIYTCNDILDRLPFSWPPAQSINPLMISMHFAKEKQAFIRLTSPKFKKYYERFGPIGCRDLFTLRALKEMGVDAYFSGCLTLTLQDQHNARNENIFFVDLPGVYKIDSPYIQAMPKQLRERIVLRTHLSSERNVAKRFSAAINLLNDYSKASLVVTSRLHCALPCLALGTPVIMVRPNDNDPRFDGLDNFLNRFTPEGFKAFAQKFNFNEELPSALNFKPLACETQERVQAFVKKTTGSNLIAKRGNLVELDELISACSGLKTRQV